MRVFVALLCFMAGCLAQRPHPCESPPLMHGELTVTTQNERLFIYAKYLYDAVGHRMRFFESGTVGNKTFSADLLLHFDQHLIYEINNHSRTCLKGKLKSDFIPLGIPKDATLLAQAIVGSSSGPGQGVLVNTWVGDLPNNGGKYMSSVTEFGCIPINTAYHTEQHGWSHTLYFNNAIGIETPDLLEPPSFCPHADMETDKEPVDFFSIFYRKD